MRPGELLVIDSGEDLRQYEPPPCAWLSEWCSSPPARHLCGFFAFFLLLSLFFAILVWASNQPHHHSSYYSHGYGGGYYGGGGSYGGGYGGGYGGYGGGAVSQPNYYQQHLLDNSATKYGATPPPPPEVVDPSIDESSFPGKEDGFERGTDENGAEVVRYEDTTSNQVYVIPAATYYDWRATNYPPCPYPPCTPYHPNHDVLMLLLASSMVHMYTSAYFYSRPGLFGPPLMPYYRSTYYTSHYGTPVVGAAGRVIYPAGGAMAGGARPMGGVGGGPGAPVSRAGTPVAQARPISQAAGGPAMGTPVAHSRPVSMHSGGRKG
jgi:hypothetical protein